ncbi:MAG: VWA domain-containing protein [Bdellovibrionales bacterium]|nr:VWA domain-containing protein [Bdellovibrionales bacterium]
MRTQGVVISIILGLLMMSGIFGQACSDVRLKEGEYMLYKATQIGVDFCTTRSDTIHSNLKFIFVVDRSGSNQTRYAGTTALPGTDVNGIRRFDAILQFVQQFQADPYVYWSLVNFSSQVLSAPNFQGFTNDKAAFANFVQDQKNRTQQIDGGWTNYMAAIDSVTAMIRRDIAAAKLLDPVIASNYVIFFVSDGEPIVNGSLQSSDSIINKIRTIALLEDEEKKLVEGIQVNTAYYYENPPDPGAPVLLNNMSLNGNGDFLQFADGQTIDFSRFAIPLRISKFDIKELWVTNINTVWHDNILQEDADADGLSDELERILGSNPNLYDSDGNEVGDGVEYRMTGGVSPCKMAGCLPAGADPYTTCRSYQQPPPSTVLYLDEDKDFLNDCEEKLLDTDFEDPDTNKDYIPDDLALKNGIKMNEASNAGYLDPDYDSIPDYQELKYNTPARIHNDNVPGHKRLTYQGGLVSSTPDQDCYHFNVTNMVTRTNRDTIRIYIMENTKTLDEKRLMRTAEKQMVGGAVYFTDADFK